MPTFNDVPESHPHYDDIEWLASKGVTKGAKLDDPSTPANEAEYAPDRSVSRAEMASFLHRFHGVVVAEPEPEPEPDPEPEPEPEPEPVPGDAVLIAAGDDILGIVGSHPAGTIFHLLAGVHTPQTIKPRNGDVFSAEPGAILDGENSVEFAFRSSAGGVTIRGLVVENYANDPSSGAIVGDGHDWVIRDCELRENRGAGLTLGDGYQVLNNHIHHNHQIGIVGSGSRILIEGNEIAYNNYLDIYDSEDEAGGTKFLWTVGLVVRGNHVHHNHNHGLWTDFENFDALYENNLVEDNLGNGIFHEISYDAVIRNNECYRNGVGIRFSSSPNVEIYGNTVVAEGSNRGIYSSNSVRGSGTRGLFEIVNLNCHDNHVTVDQGYSGLHDNFGDEAVWFSNNNRWENNTYVSNTSRPFYWQGNTTKTWAEWQGYGNDLTGAWNR